MTSFVHVDQPLVHPGVQRAEVLFGRVAAARGSAAGTRHLLTLLLVAAVAIALVVAEVLVSEWTESRLLAAWAVLGGALLIGVALYAGPLRSAVQRFLARRAEALADARFLATAQRDPRVMQELQAAIVRKNSEAELAASVQPRAIARSSAPAQEGPMPTLYQAMRSLN